MTEAETAREKQKQDEARAQSPVDELPDSPERHQQDTQPVEGEDAMNLPPETDMIQRPIIQG